jgi:putative thioredoxin
MAVESPWISSTTDATFEQDVLEVSKTRPVVVDFWATWCQPCLALKPVLERLAVEYDGRFQLVKAETEHNQSAAAQFNVSGIPAVFAVAGGELVDSFTGALPEAQIRPWLDRLLLTAEVVGVQGLETSDPAAAEAKYRALIEKLPREPSLTIGLARVLLALERIDEAKAIVEKLEERGFLEPEAQKLKASLDLAGMRGGNVGALEARAAAEPNNFDLQLELAEALAGAGQHEAALQRSLAILQQQKTGPGEKAKQLMLDLFRVLPADSELTSVYRRKLASALY